MSYCLLDKYFMTPGWHNKILLDLYYLEQKALKVHFIHLLHIALVIKQTTSRNINQRLR